MMFFDACLGRRALGVVLPLAMLAGTVDASAHSVSDEVGRWVGFAHQHGQTVAGSRVVLDLHATTTTAVPQLEGTIVGLPAVQDALHVIGNVTQDGFLHLRLDGTGVAGFCDGSVRLIDGYSRPGDEDALGNMEYELTFATNAAPVRGHFNALHLFGGINWGDVSGINLLGGSRGAFMEPRANEADGSVMKVSEQRGSFIGGMVGLSGNAFDMVGTSNGRGSTVMMCDGSVKTATGASALIGLLFTGGATAPAAGGAPEVVGHWGAEPFAVFLPAVQRTRGGAMSFSYAAPGA